MKKFLPLFFIIVFSLFTKAQNSATIDINKISTTVYSDGELFRSETDTITNEEAPIGSGKKINFMGKLWLAGNDNNNNLHVAVNFRSGPLDTTDGSYNAQVNIAFDHVWKINKSMIQYFQQVYQNNPQLIPADILSWPGNGTGNQAHRLAPFIDLNNNDIYEPLLGDYPKLIGDEMLFLICSDYVLPNGALCSTNIGAEIHLTVYAYNCDSIDANTSNEALNNTVFYHYDIYNRSGTTYNDFYVSWWQDPDLGYFGDDFVGCDTTRNAAFVYNGDNDDEGATGYGVNPPMQSYVQLDGPPASLGDGLDNDHDGATDEAGEKMLFTNFMIYNNDSNPVSGNPENCLQVYNYMHSFWLDGTQLMYGGINGFPSGEPTNYFFPAAPYNGQGWGWSETADGNTPGDRRLIMSCGPTTLQPQGDITVEYAIVYSHYSSAPNGANTSFALNNAYVDNITSWYNAQAFPSCYNPTTLAEIPVAGGKLEVYPNPATNLVNIKLVGYTGLLNFCVTDMAGKTVMCGQGNTLNLDGLANGMYLLYVNNNKDAFYSKLIKQ